MTTTNENRTMLPQAMRDAVIEAGGKISRIDYFQSVHEIIHANGGDTDIESLKTSTVNANRLRSAGLTKVNIGARSEIWLDDLAEGA